MCRRCEKESKLHTVKRNFIEKNITYRALKKVKCSQCGHMFFLKNGMEIEKGFLT